MDLKIHNLLKNAQQAPVLSKFLTITEQKCLVSSELKIVFSNNYPNEERKRAYLYSNKLDLIPDFKISFLKIVANTKIKHPDVLGAIMSLGITREVIGDIIISDDIFIIIASEIEKYIKDNLLMINKSKVEIIVVDDLSIGSTNNYLCNTIIIPSMRVDVIVSKALNLSREKAQQLISLKQIKINGMVCLNNDYNCKINDIVSILKFGRIIIKDIARKTKKEKLVLNIERTK